MKQLHFVLLVFLSVLFQNLTMAQNNYDFYSTSPSGHVLYYKIIDDNIAYVTWQNPSGISYDNLSGAVIIPSSVSHEGNTYLVTGIDNDAFKGCWNLSSIFIPNTVTTIGTHAFDHCSILSSISWSDSVLYLGDYAFSNCSSLFSIIIPSSVISIGKNTFQNCAAATSIIIGNNVTTIGEGAFINCTNATSLTIGNSVVSIGNDAFDGCLGLTSVNIPSSVSYIGASAFFGCTNLTHTSYSGTVSEWLNIRFGGTFSSPVLYSRCLYINDTVVKSVIIPDGVTKINYNTFCGMDSLCIVQLPSSLLAIDHYAFYECSGLSKIEIPSSVNSIGRRAFYGCSNLDTIVCAPTTPPSCVSDSPYHLVESFDGVPLTAKVLVPCQSVDDYQASIGWDYFTNYIPQNNSVIYSISSSNPTMGSVDYLVADECGHSIIANATPYEGCYFLYWSDGSTINPYFYHSDSNEIVLIAYFNTSDGIIVTLTPNDITMGGVTGGGVYHDGDTVVCTAIPFSGYEFRGWSNGNQENPYIFVAYENTELMAVFVKEIGVEENANEQHIIVYPNPANTIVAIDKFSDKIPDMIHVIDQLGRIVKCVPNNSIDGKLFVDVSDLKSGIYFVRIGTSIYKLMVQ